MEVIDITVKTETPFHLGSGHGDVLVDAEVVHDEYGMPYLPAKRFRGLLYESALEVVEILKASKLAFLNEEDLIRVFGRDKKDSAIRIHNLHLKDYDAMRKVWDYMQKNFGEVITPVDVLKEYTELRQFTSIDYKTGVATTGSLRNLRVFDAGLEFHGQIELLSSTGEEQERDQILLAFALKNLKYMGLKRNRGFGQITCAFKDVAKQTELIKEAFNHVEQEV